MLALVDGERHVVEQRPVIPDEAHVFHTQHRSHRKRAYGTPDASRLARGRPTAIAPEAVAPPMRRAGGRCASAALAPEAVVPVAVAPAGVAPAADTRGGGLLRPGAGRATMVTRLT
ncbi:hypothetical protein GCM10029978_099100 [Actinoallomurus acanthiterrae]